MPTTMRMRMRVLIVVSARTDGVIGSGVFKMMPA
jgi:hypothetical protein